MQVFPRKPPSSSLDARRRRLLVSATAACLVGLGTGLGVIGLRPRPARAQNRSASVIDVGPGQIYRTPGEAAHAVGDGDTVRIFPGDYVDCASWRANHLHILAPEGGVTVRDRICERKGIWVISGDNIVVDGITFTGAALPNRIGAGIRAQGTNLTVRNCRFIENQLGLLANPIAESTITIEASVFLRNGPSHGVYVNPIGRLVVRDSIFREHRIRHPIKSRAFQTDVIGNTIEDGNTGSSSYLVESPNGGTVTVVGNTLHKGPNTDNPGTAISIGVEGNLHSSNGILIAENLFTNEGPTRTVFVRNFTETPAVLRRNRLRGAVEPLAGLGDWQPDSGG